MRIGRSTFYDTSDAGRARPDHRCGDENDLRRVRSLRLSACDAELRHRGIVVNAKKIRRLMREHEQTNSASGCCGAISRPYEFSVDRVCRVIIGGYRAKF